MTARLIPFRSPGAALRKFASRCVALGLLVVCTAAGSKKMDPSIAVRFHGQTNTFDTSFAAKVSIGTPPREVLVEKIATISERDIASFYPYKASDGSYSVAFQLDRHGQLNLETLSASKRGTLLVCFVNGRYVAALTIDKTITDGIIFIPSGLTLDDVHNMGASFTIMGQENAPKPGKKPKPVDPEDTNPLAPR